MRSARPKSKSKRRELGDNNCECGRILSPRRKHKAAQCVKCRRERVAAVTQIRSRQWGTVGAFRIGTPHKDVKTRRGWVMADLGQWVVLDKYGWPSICEGSEHAPDGYTRIGELRANIGYSRIPQINLR